SAEQRFYNAECRGTTTIECNSATTTADYDIAIAVVILEQISAQAWHSVDEGLGDGSGIVLAVGVGEVVVRVEILQNRLDIGQLHAAAVAVELVADGDFVGRVAIPLDDYAFMRLFRPDGVAVHAVDKQGQQQKVVVHQGASLQDGAFAIVYFWEGQITRTLTEALVQGWVATPEPVLHSAQLNIRQHRPRQLRLLAARRHNVTLCHPDVHRIHDIFMCPSGVRICFNYLKSCEASLSSGRHNDAVFSCEDHRAIGLPLWEFLPGVGASLLQVFLPDVADPRSLTWARRAGLSRPLLSDRKESGGARGRVAVWHSPVKESGEVIFSWTMKRERREEDEEGRGLCLDAALAGIAEKEQEEGVAM
ncbi:hypothetical protein L7F22_036198, partial [Adiantum nelumboides]|nr:hypothetical protein [Adiantum nelumboides]